MYISIMSPFLSSNCQLKKILWYRVVPLHLIRNPPIKYLFVPYGMKFQLSKLRLLRITFYVVQRTSEIMHNLCPNPINYLGRSFRHILEYLQTFRLPNIPNCDTTYQLPSKYTTLLLHLNFLYYQFIPISLQSYICRFPKYTTVIYYQLLDGQTDTSIYIILIT